MTVEPAATPRAIPRWAWIGLVLVLLFDVWLRGHALGPTFPVPYPVTGTSPTPLDCDEGIYGYIGDRLARGEVMYRDVTENKPPGGYWLYMLAVRFGGMTERTIRLMPMPMVLLTIALVWRLALRLGGPLAAVLAAGTYAVVNTDPYTYADGAQMEVPLNLFATATLGCFVEALAIRSSSWVAGAESSTPRNQRQEKDRGVPPQPPDVRVARTRHAWLFASGLCLGAAMLVKQIAALHGVVFAVALMLPAGVESRARFKPLSILILGALVPLLTASFLLLAEGAGLQAYQDIFVYGRALATQTPSPPNAPAALVRWLTGNADPSGALPWPFGKSTYLAWWGTGTWPIWLASGPALLWLTFGRGVSASRRFVAAWTLAAAVQVVLPGLYWPHYYQLPTPGLAVALAVFLGDMVSGVTSNRSILKRFGYGLAGLLAVAAILETARIQARDYLLVPAERLVNVKGGQQWIALRGLGAELARRSMAFDRASLFVWGWQGSLYFYSGYAHVTPQVFVDDFLKSFARTGNPVSRPRVERTIRDLRARPPSAMFVAYPPFPELEAFLHEHYRPSRLSPGLWIINARHDVFEAYSSPWAR